MKNKIITLIATLTLNLISVVGLVAQTKPLIDDSGLTALRRGSSFVPASLNGNLQEEEWTRYSDNPILSEANINTQDPLDGAFASVLIDDTDWKMYYTVSGGGSLRTRRIGLATSSNGLDWTDQGIILTQTSGAWDNDRIWCPIVIKIGPNEYKMLYTGEGNRVIQIGLATSTDGVNWTKYSGNPVFNDPSWAHNVTKGWGIIKVEDTYILWYNTLVSTQREVSCATSSDLIHWTPYQSKPIFETSGDPSDFRYNQFCVLPFKYGFYYYIIIPSYNSSREYARLCLYRCPNPYFLPGDREFVKVVLYTSSSGWDSHDLDTPWVLFHDNKLYMYYSGEVDGKWRTGLTIENDISAALAPIASVPYRIMPLGNSITQGNHGFPSGYRDDLAHLLLEDGIDFEMVGSINDRSGFYPWHEGHSGRTADEIDAEINSWLNASSPNIVLLHIGTNDISRGESNESTIIEIERILDKIYNHNSRTIILLCSLIPRFDSWENRPQRTDELNLLIKQLFNQKRNEGFSIYYVGQNESFKSNENWTQDYMSDYVHPNDDGYHIMAVTFFNILKNIFNPVSYSIAGRILYYANNNPINEVVVDLSGGNSSSFNTDTDGFYEFNDLSGNEYYEVHPNKDKLTRSENNVITMYNAALTLRHAVGLDTLSENSQIAANVDQDDQILAYDAALIARYVVGLPQLPDDQVGEWTFIPDERIYQNLISNQQDQDFIGILLGDVAGGWDQDNFKKSKQSEFEWLSNIIAEPGDMISIPIKLFEDSLLSLDAIIEYPENTIEFINITKSEAAGNFELLYHSENNVIKMGAYIANPMQINGEFINLNFRIIGRRGSVELLLLRRLQINNYSLENAITELAVSGKEYSPATIKFVENYPNPFNPSTVISYEISQPGNVKIIIFNLLGQETKNLLNEKQSPGCHQITWDGRDNFGKSVANGIYIYRVIFNDQLIEKTMLKLE